MWLVRESAVQAPPGLTEKGDQQVIAPMAARLDQADEEVREAAVKALSELAEMGDQQVIAALAARPQDAVWPVGSQRYRLHPSWRRRAARMPSMQSAST